MLQQHNIDLYTQKVHFLFRLECTAKNTAQLLAQIYRSLQGEKSPNQSHGVRRSVFLLSPFMFLAIKYDLEYGDFSGVFTRPR